jgi:hypothetical protein
MEQEGLAQAAGISANTIRRMEGFDGPIGARTDSMRRLQRALEAAGVEFRPDGSVRLREPAEAAR